MKAAVPEPVLDSAVGVPQRAELPAADHSVLLPSEFPNPATACLLTYPHHGVGKCATNEFRPCEAPVRCGCSPFVALLGVSPSGNDRAPHRARFGPKRPACRLRPRHP